MPLFALICTDKADRFDLRAATRDAHLAWLNGHGLTRQAGPFLDDQGRPCGSLIVLEVPDRATAQALAAQDPYAQAGLFAKVRIEEWRKVI
jgi:uncharacterized protein